MCAVSAPPKLVIDRLRGAGGQREEQHIMGSAINNGDLVRQGYEAFNSADLETLGRLFTEEVSWITPGRSSVAGHARGRDAVFAQFGRYGAETQGSFRAELKQVLTAPDGTVIGVHHNGGERNGKQLDTDCCIVFEFEDGRVVSGREYFSDLYNWDQFWS